MLKWYKKFFFVLLLFLLLNLISEILAEESIFPSRRRYEETRIMDKFNDDVVVPCGAFKHVKVNESLVIQSPNFSRTTSNRISSTSQSCKWRFLFPGCALTLSCPQFRLNSLFCMDYFEIKDLNGTTQRYCGRKGPNLRIDSKNKQVEFIFRTNPFFNSDGFRCRVFCPGNNQNGDGSIIGGLVGGSSGIGGIIGGNGGIVGIGRPGASAIPDILPKPSVAPTNCTCGEGAHGVKIINGEMTAIGEFPWMAGLVRVGSIVPFCGAALINSLYVITAAHCVARRTPDNLLIILNEPSAQGGTSVVPRRIEMIMPHRSYSARLDYDVAIIKLAQPVDLTGDIVPVCLSLDSTENYLKKVATVSGWGTTYEGGPLSRYLQKVDVDVISNEQCSLVYPLVVTTRMLCAYRENKDACQGDSGGPMMIGSNFRTFRSMDKNYKGRTMTYAKYTQVGIVSWGQGCARKDKPGVYAKLSEFMPWIKAVINDGSFCVD